ncbi:MAG: hypothetical protein DRP85_07440 [Candidatus Makaraimicrobium thalassicum]|nr:MAG: hypothetical protein DRP85_07440 [Candidatus Omnitrophota bacterium]
MLRIHGGGNIGGSTGNGYAMALTIDTGTLIVSGIINNTRDNTFSSGSDDYSLSGATTIKAGSISLGGGLIKSGNQITQTIKYCTLTPEVCEDAVGCPNIIAEPGKLFLIRYCEFPPPTCFGGDGCTQPCSPVDPDCPPPPTPTSAPTLLSLDGTVTDTDNQPINGTVTVESLKKCRNSGCSSFSGFVSLAGATNDVFIIDGIVNGMIGPYNTFTDITYLLTVKVCNDLSTPICDQIQIRFTD